MHVDYRKWPAGVALAAKIVLSACPVCGASCHERRRRRETLYVHEVTLERRVSKKSLRAYTRVTPHKLTTHRRGGARSSS